MDLYFDENPFFFMQGMGGGGGGTTTSPHLYTSATVY